MNLVLDIGNTRTKLSLFNFDNEVVYFKSFDNKDEKCLFEEIEKKDFDRAIISSVSKSEEKIADLVRKKCDFCVVLSSDTKIPLINRYKTPETLGTDRIATAVGAYSQKPGKNILVIDSGTCVTYDLISSKGEFIGGNISPGVHMRLEALNKMTSRLPLVSAEGDIPCLGYDTHTAIRSGVFWGLEYEMCGYIDEINKKYDDVFVFLTGGGVKSLDKKLKISIFADDFLLLKGLNYILNYNYEGF